MSNGPQDFDVIRTNAANDGISLAEITIMYEGLTSFELEQMRQAGLIVNQNNLIVLGRFTNDGNVMFPEKTTGVMRLGA
jgi:hypothetical protein